MSEKRVIKKYPNRRLYDTEVSKYITMEDLRKLVLSGVDFAVIDVKSDEDLTRSILLQIIAEQEHGGNPIFSTETLTKIIRFYGDSMQTVASDYLTQSLELFSQQQQQMQEQFKNAVSNSPMNPLSDLVQNNMEMWRTMQENFYKSAGIDLSGDDEKEQ